MTIIGICGNARSGKDTLADLIAESLLDVGIKSKKLALANELKEECQDLVWKNLGIDIFTDNTEEKNIIRPLLVTWGTHVRRKLNPNIWIEKVEEKISENELVIIPDIRYSNELEWLRKKDSYCIFVDRIDENGNLIPPANEEEKENYPFLKENCDFQLSWQTVGTESIQDLKPVAIEVIKKTISQEIINSWTQTFS
jgi:hypothetical protein